MELQDFAREIVKDAGLRESIPRLLADHPIVSALAAGAGAGVGTAGSLYYGAGRGGRKRVGSDSRDPRTYSNLRGMLLMESAKDRVRAHKKLSKNKGGGVLSAMKKGFTRS